MAKFLLLCLHFGSQSPSPTPRKEVAISPSGRAKASIKHEMIMRPVERTIQYRRRYFEVSESEMAPAVEREVQRRLSDGKLKLAPGETRRADEPMRGCTIRPLRGPASQTSEVSSGESPSEMSLRSEEGGSQHDEQGRTRTADESRSSLWGSESLFQSPADLCACHAARLSTRRE